MLFAILSTVTVIQKMVFAFHLFVKTKSFMRFKHFGYLKRSLINFYCLPYETKHDYKDCQNNLFVASDYVYHHFFLRIMTALYNFPTNFQQDIQTVPEQKGETLICKLLVCLHLNSRPAPIFRCSSETLD